MLKRLIKKITSDFIFELYYKTWAVLASLVYFFPSKKLVVIGVTGTKGKSTVSNMIWKVLNDNGLKTGMTTTANFRIGEEEWINNTKMTMQGRMRLQKLLRQMVRAGCTHAVVETSSEGIKQFRHWGIDYNTAVFTNLTPEHIESHGGFLNYKLAKAELFSSLRQGYGGQEKLSKKKNIPSTIVVNVDDEHSEFYNSYPADKHITYSINKNSDIRAEDIEIKNKGSYFVVNDKPFYIPLRGEFNIYNSLAAIAVARSLDIEWQGIVNALAKFDYMPGRMEEIKSNKGFSVFVDYAHTAESLEAVYKTLKSDKGRLIAVLGSCGGGRDKAKRPILGALAGKYADVVIITDEDPYDEDVETIIDEVWAGLIRENNTVEKYKIIDRAEAIKKAIELATAGDVVVVTGKGSEQCLVTNKGKIDWDDRKVVRRYI